LKDASVAPKKAINIKKTVLTSKKNKFDNLKKPNNALFTKKPLKYIEKPLGAST
jgi:hypothetical protein